MDHVSLLPLYEKDAVLSMPSQRRLSRTRRVGVLASVIVMLGVLSLCLQPGLRHSVSLTNLFNTDDEPLPRGVETFSAMEAIQPPGNLSTPPSNQTPPSELRRQTAQLRDVLIPATTSRSSSRQEAMLRAADREAASLFPFLSDAPSSSHNKPSLSGLRAAVIPGSAGLVVPVGDEDVRAAAQLVSAIRFVLHSRISIQIAYAGEGCLSAENRDLLVELVGHIEGGEQLEFLDILTMLGDTDLNHRDSGGVTEAFAVLGSSFEKVILAGADTVFLQRPEVLLSHPAVRRSGALLFRDGSPKQGDTGVVVVDKGQADVLKGLLHVCWQNTHEVRQGFTGQLAHGSEESWRTGFELAGSRHEVETHSGVVVGWQMGEPAIMDTRGAVCSSVIAHSDGQGRLLWYNGGLRRAKKTAARVYDMPSTWMVGGEWVRVGHDQGMSCMVGSEPRSLSSMETVIVEESIFEARRVDALLDLD